MSTVKDETIRKYLLNALSESEREWFEEQYFEHDDIYRRMEFLKDELVSDYVYGRLAPSECLSFESHHFATPERRQRIEMAKEWRSMIVASGPRKLSVRLTMSLNDRFRSLADIFNLPTIIVATAAVVFMTATIVVWNYLNSRQQKELATGIELAGAKPPERHDGPERYAEVHLTPVAGLPGALADEARSLVIPAGFSGAVFSLSVPHEERPHAFKTCVAELYRGEATGTPIWETEIGGAGLHSRSLPIKVPMAAFDESEVYTILLTRYLTKEKRLQHSHTTIYRVNVTLE